MKSQYSKVELVSNRFSLPHFESMPISYATWLTYGFDFDTLFDVVEKSVCGVAHIITHGPAHDEVLGIRAALQMMSETANCIRLTLLQGVLGAWLWSSRRRCVTQRGAELSSGGGLHMTERAAALVMSNANRTTVYVCV